MKKFLLSLLTIIALGFSASATDYTTGAIPSGSWSASNTTATLNDVSWESTLVWQTANKTYWGYDATKGFQFGSGSNPCASATISTEEINGTISKIIVNASTASSGNCKLAVKVNDNAFLCGDSETVSLTTTATAYTFVGEATGKIEVIYTNSAKKAVYIKQIDVTYEGAAATVAPTDLTIKYGDIQIAENDEVSVMEGTELSISAKDATNITITDIDDNLLASFNGSSCTWTPEVMDENFITVTASNEVGEISTIFSLVVTEKVHVPGEFDFINNDYGMERLSGATSEYNPDPFTFGDDVVTITLNGSTRLWSSDGIRFYKGSKFSVKAAKGYYITDINFEGGLTNNVTVDGVKNDGSWTGASGEVEFVSTHESGNKVMSTLTVKVAELPEGVHNFTTVDVEDAFTISKDVESATITITGVHAESELYYKFTEAPAVNPEAAPRKVVDHTGYTKVEPNGDGTHTVTVDKPGTLELYAYHPATDSKSEIKTINVTKASETTAIDEIGADIVEGEAEYFNLQGVKINPENAAPGLYIRRQGGKVAKVMVK